MKNNTLKIPAQKTPDFSLPPHTVTWKQDLSHLKQSFSDEDLSLYLRLYEKASTHPKQAKKELEAFLVKHPHHPELLNLLTYLYLSLRKLRKGNRLIEENYRHNPDYLFSKINYADLCLRKKCPQKIPEIFNYKLNLPELYPNKKMFHISEFRGFMILMGFYHLAIGRRSAAEGYHYLAARVDPEHPSTKILDKKIYYIPFYKRFILKLFRR
ncbi:MAG: hypothetical protein E6Q36_04690 [Chryseobacterium sp.]|jgi:hypothetical protein|nr:MAG: hypothetical protein E6Q36_04690 [Chryseobacterium sp.]